MDIVHDAFFGPSEFDPHTEPHDDITSGQTAFFFIWAACAVLWLARWLKIVNTEDLNKFKAYFGKNHKDIKSVDEEKLLGDSKENEARSTDVSSAVTVNSKSEIRHQTNGDNAKITTTEASKGTGTNTEKGGSPSKTFSAVRSPPTLDEFLKNVTILGIILWYFYLCDYKKIFPMLERVYSRDEFLFFVFLLFLCACAFTIRPTSDKILNRDQTEEWKGWMQVMFVWYHVFAAKEWYNWIRVYIAAYVWMTGFGNFSFFWVRKDFSMFRFLKMQFRLNFLVTCLCVAVSNEYMLYYICAMHSYWFISVYVFMGVLKSWNTDAKKMAVKFAAYFIINCVIFEIDVVKYTIFKPFMILLRYSDPRFEPMHEWGFRAGLDHWACFFGMICAYNYPHFEKFLTDLEKSENYKKTLLTKLGMILSCVGALSLWYWLFMGKDKFSYNATHPYTSMIPIVCFIMLRNSFPVLRNYYIHLFAWLGKITLETYLSQLHIYLQSNAKHLIGYLPKDYHLLNFALATCIYLPISYKLFNVTTVFSSYLIPNDMKVVTKNALFILIAFGVPYVAALVYMNI